MTITDSDLDAIEARAAIIGNDPDASNESGESNRYIEWIFTDAENAALESVLSDVPRLVAEVRRLRAGLASLRETMRQMVEDLGGD